MKIITAEDIKDKKVLLRLDLDVPVENGIVAEDFRLEAGIPTLKLCLENASKVIIIGHLGRPENADPLLSLRPVCEWFAQNGFPQMRFEQDSALVMLENLRFDPGEENLDTNYAKKLALLADIFVFEAFASYRPAVSTTVLPTLMPHFAGLRFVKEVEVLSQVRENPKKPFVAVMGGAKVEDKLPVIEVLAKEADAVLVGGKLVSELTNYPAIVGKNVFVGKLTEDGLDMAPETIESWRPLLMGATLIVWNGPVGKIDQISNIPGLAPRSGAGKDQKLGLGSERGSFDLAKLILESKAETIIGGGDTIAFLNKVGLLEKFEKKGFVSTGGGAMLKLLTNGSLPTIEALGI